MATKKVPDPQAQANTPAAVVDAFRDVFGEHPEDVIGPIEWGANTLLQVAEILSVIAQTARDGGQRDLSRIRRLAEAGKHLADDMGDTMDCRHSDFVAALRERAVAVAGGTP